MFAHIPSDVIWANQPLSRLDEIKVMPISELMFCETLEPRTLKRKE